MILGSSGMAGHVLTQMLRGQPDQYEVLDISRSSGAIHPAYIFDVTDFDRLKKFIEEKQPSVIINCIGLLNQVAEDHPDQAILVNTYLPHFLEAVTKGSSVKVIHISTDCVFSGKRGGYKETDFKDGIGFYAQTKALGELINSKDLTIRTSIVGPELKNGMGLFNWFAQQKETIKGYTGAFWTGVTTIELAKAIIAAIEQQIVGLFQLVYTEKITKFDLLKLFDKQFNAGLDIIPYDGYHVDKSLVNTRTDFNYKVPSYEVMISEMCEWMGNHKDLYISYGHLLV